MGTCIRDRLPDKWQEVLDNLANKDPQNGKRKFAVLSGVSVFVIILVLTVWGGLKGAHEVASARAKQEQSGRASQPDVEPADPERGGRLFEQLRCAACHHNPSRGVNIPPGLELAGSKFQKRWLEAYLRDPHRIRWSGTNVRPVARMPDFNLTNEEARNITAFLMEKIAPERIGQIGIDWSNSDSMAIAEGKRLVSQYACSGCHVIGDGGTNLGPSLNHVGSKLQPDYIYHFILKPKEVIPETPMKDNQLWEDEAQAIVRYLLTLQ